MSTPVISEPRKKHTPYVPETMEMKEFTFRALLIGLVMTAILGSANAYLGLKAGMTIAATYPAAVIGMALLRLMKGSLLEENIARTVGSIGESVAAGAVFTIPAFVMAELWPGLTAQQYWKSVALMIIGGTLGILFVNLLRRVMVEDPELPYPESVAASEIHKAGQQGAKAAKILFANMGFGGLMYLLGAEMRGILCSDRWRAYDVVPLLQRQVCWAHLKRNFEKWLEEGGKAKEIGEACLSIQSRTRL